MTKNDALPKGWQWVKLGELCEKTLGGGTPSTANTDYWKGRIPWMTSADIVNAKTIKPRKYITAKAVANSATNLIPKNNIIVVTRVGLGKAVKNEMDICISQDSQGLILKKSVCSDFLIYSLIEKIKTFKLTSQGSTIQGITKKRLLDIEIPLPPLYQQKAIASLLETWDTAIEKTESLIAAKEKRFKWLLKTFTKPAKDWKKSAMSDSFDLGRGRVISKKYIEENKGIYPVFSSQTFNNGELGKINTFDFKGDYITWTTDGANAGEVFFRTGKFNCTNVCGTAKPKDEKEIYACFIAYYLKGKTKKYVSYVGNPKLMNGVFGTIPIRYPSYIRQQVISHILNTAQQEIVLLEKLAETYRTQKRGLMQKLLTGKWRIRLGDN